MKGKPGVREKRQAIDSREDKDDNRI